MSDTTNNPEDQMETRLEDLENDEEVENEDTEDASKEESSDERVYTKADIEKAAARRQKALEKARQLEKELTELKKASATKEERLRMEAAEEAARKAEELYKPAIIQKHLYYEMAALGLTKEQIPDLVDLIKTNNIDIDDDFNVTGVEEEVERIRQRFPRLFDNDVTPDEEKKPAGKKRPAPKSDGAPKTPPAKPMTSRDRLLARMRGENV